MSDLIDRASAYCDQLLQDQIELAKTTEDKFLGKGKCHNCDSILEDRNGVFCDSDCANDYYKRVDNHNRMFNLK